jgi:hypothetical protein
MQCSLRNGQGGRGAVFNFHLIFIQCIAEWADCHLDSAGFKGKDENSLSTFTLGRVAVFFTRRAVSSISGVWEITVTGYGWRIDHLGN